MLQKMGDCVAAYHQLQLKPLGISHNNHEKHRLTESVKRLLITHTLNNIL